MKGYYLERITIIEKQIAFARVGYMQNVNRLADKLKSASEEETDKIIDELVAGNEFLAEKINNGTPFEKDGKPLINKKTLSGFMKYACDEARKLADKNATSACVKDEIVFAWAMHYFEENEIVGTLYNDDGTEYKPTPKKENKPTQRIPSPTVSKKPDPKIMQFSFFDTPTEKSIPTKTEPLLVDEETGEILRSEPKRSEKKSVPIPQASPLYQKYMRAQNEHPHAVVAYRLGDFFEIFGDNAVRIAEQLDLTLTGRDCGLAERVPMIGFPYHAAELYFQKIANSYELIVIDGDTVTPYKTKENEDTMHENIPVENKNEPIMYEDNDENDIFEEELAVQKFFDKTALFTLYELFDYELDMQ